MDLPCIINLMLGETAVLQRFAIPRVSASSKIYQYHDIGFIMHIVEIIKKNYIVRTFETFSSSAIVNLKVKMSKQKWPLRF